MPDFDPEAYLDTPAAAQSTAPAFDPEAYLDHPEADKKQPKVEPDDFFSRSPVAGTLRHVATSLGANATAGVRSIYDLTQGVPLGKIDEKNRKYIAENTYNPPQGSAAGITVKGLESPYNPMNWPGMALDYGGQKVNEATGSTVAGPVLSGAGQVALSYMGARGALKGAPPTPMEAPESILSRMDSQQSTSAAAAAPNLTNVSPELKTAVSQAAAQTGGAVNPETFARHAEADSLPVKIQLTPGQASQDPALISHEQNNRANITGLPDLLNRQNKQLGENVQAIRDRVGPDVFSANEVEHGDTLIGAYKDKAQAAEKDITAKYQALKDANGGQFPVDSKALLDNATAALHKDLLFDHAPAPVMRTLGRLADQGNMTMENYESLRTNLATIQRTATDGNERRAAGIIRQAMEELPLNPGAAQLKPLADAARGAARRQFQAVEADPAYKAAVSDSVPPDKFVRKFVTGPSATRDSVAQMRAFMDDNDTAKQTMAVAALDHLRDASGSERGTFSQAAFNKQLMALSPRLRSLVDPKTAEQLETLGNVARYTQSQPKGSYVNNSNTLVGALAEHGASAVEGLVNFKAGGLPMGTVGRKLLEKRAQKKATAETMTPYGGLNRLSDVGRQQ